MEVPYISDKRSTAGLLCMVMPKQGGIPEIRVQPRRPQLRVANISRTPSPPPPRALTDVKLDRLIEGD